MTELYFGDSVRLHQILINLLSNAIKFTSEGNITINVNKSSTKQKITIEFKVSDTGIEFLLIKLILFLKILNKHTLFPLIYGGTGLGLAIVKATCRKQGGTITVDKVDVGTTFSCILIFKKQLLTLCIILNLKK
jgi:signal transduction histidine kinase